MPRRSSPLALLVLLTLLGFWLAAGPVLADHATDTATYEVLFQSTWSASTHPQSFPPQPHFSPITGGVHNGEVSFWQEGGIASPGIERMAERGQVTPLDDEVQTAIDAGHAREIIEGRGIPVSPGSRTTTFTVSRQHSLATVVSMLAPSPDWFVGVSGLELFEGGDWVEQKVETLYVWDAGTDSGGTYLAGDRDTQPREPIRPLLSGPFSHGAPVGTFTFTRLESPQPQPLMLRGGRFAITAEWMDFDLTRARANPVVFSDDTGYFWFFEDGNVELIVKVIDGCGFNQRFWVFAGGLTNVEVELRVEDTQTGQVNVYDNTLGNPFQPIQDTDAFATCP